MLLTFSRYLGTQIFRKREAKAAILEDILPVLTELQGAGTTQDGYMTIVIGPGPAVVDEYNVRQLAQRGISGVHIGLVEVEIVGFRLRPEIRIFGTPVSAAAIPARVLLQSSQAWTTSGCRIRNSR